MFSLSLSSIFSYITLYEPYNPDESNMVDKINTYENLKTYFFFFFYEGLLLLLFVLLLWNCYFIYQGLQGYNSFNLCDPGPQNQSKGYVFIYLNINKLNK